ncbi:hypothetical protein Rhopal_000421-T1 [Rhodotorula paludigena]|uniref:MHD domain-containing protein n=1 Tax=Rhodotorula paludigena TaxID=86838 RepID=A0AAV5GEE3_9BASI|nr:hypothetical protein Rhopal_000421-T1 [Rhodotorula paludigena]
MGRGRRQRGQRRILSTHFANSLDAALAIDAAVAHSKPVVWVHSQSRHTHDSDDSDDDGDDDDHRPHHTRTRTAPRGLAVCQIERAGLRYIAPVDHDKLYETLKTYIGGPVTEGSLKVRPTLAHPVLGTATHRRLVCPTSQDHFDVVLALLHEMVAGGRPQLSQSSQLKELVVPPDSQFFKVALNAATAAGLNIPSQTTANALVASPLPWRRQGIRYTSNEIYFDLTETLSFTLDAAGKPLSCSIAGALSCRSRLSGMPDLALTFTDPAVLDESAAFHSCVRYGRWNKDKVVSFVPPDGSFPLLSFVHTPPSTTPALALALLPLSLSTSSVTLGPSGGSFRLALTSRAPPSRPLTRLELRLPLARGAHAVQATATGGALATDERGRSVGGGAGRWEVVEREGKGVEGSKGEERQVLVWKVDQLCSTDRPAVLEGQYYASPDARKPPFLTLTFDSPASGFSGLRINTLKVLNEQYSVYKGVKTRGRAEIEVRTG